MFNNQRDRRYSIIVTVVAALACAGVFWIRSASPKVASPAGTTPATFNLTDPLPQAHDGAREVIGQVYECVTDGKHTFSNRSCAATK